MNKDFLSYIAIGISIIALGVSAFAASALKKQRHFDDNAVIIEQINEIERPATDSVRKETIKKDGVKAKSGAHAKKGKKAAKKKSAPKQ
jgi:hypothetical protein